MDIYTFFLTTKA